MTGWKKDKRSTHTTQAERRKRQQFGTLCPWRMAGERRTDGGGGINRNRSACSWIKWRGTAL